MTSNPNPAIPAAPAGAAAASTAAAAASATASSAAAARLHALAARVGEAFARRHGGRPAAMVQAPGRVNLIGEHTDYNRGFVLPCAIDRGTVVAIRPRADRRIRAVALDYEAALDEFAIDRPIEHRRDASWPNYLRGIAIQLIAAGAMPGGADLAISGDLPSGAGLSSSASLSIAVVQAFKAAYGLSAPDPTTAARLAQASENEFFGCRCGIMDPLISARGEAGHALLIDCSDDSARAVAMPRSLELLIVHSKIRRGLVDSEYNRRREQCETAAAHYRVGSLRELDPRRLEAERAGLDPLAYRRARHVLTENARTLAAADALAAGDAKALGRLMAESHASMRDDFEISVPAMDRLVEVLQSAIGDGGGGARMTGGGFGGCAVAMVPGGRVDDVIAAVAADYRSPQGEAALIQRCTASAGAGPIA